MGPLNGAAILAATLALGGCGAAPTPPSRPEPGAGTTPLRSVAAPAPALAVRRVDSSPSDLRGAFTYRAGGTEPFWTMGVDGAEGRWRLIRPGVPDRRGRIDGVERRGGPPTVRGTAANGDRLLLVAEDGPASDGMSDLRFAHHTTLALGSERFHGYGGDILPPLSLAGTTWYLLRLNGAKGRPNGLLDFNAAGLTVSGWCPDLRFLIADVEVRRFTVTGGPTRLSMCQEVTLPLELTRLLAGEVRADYAPNGVLTLRGNGVVATLKRSI